MITHIRHLEQLLLDKGVKIEPFEKPDKTSEAASNGRSPSPNHSDSFKDGWTQVGNLEEDLPCATNQLASQHTPQQSHYGSQSGSDCYNEYRINGPPAFASGEQHPSGSLSGRVSSRWKGYNLESTSREGIFVTRSTRKSQGQNRRAQQSAHLSMAIGEDALRWAFLSQLC